MPVPSILKKHNMRDLKKKKCSFTFVSYSLFKLCSVRKAFLWSRCGACLMFLIPGSFPHHTGDPSSGLPCSSNSNVSTDHLEILLKYR